MNRTKENGLRKTQAREAVLQILNRAKRPLSHQEIQSKIKKGAFDRVTIYRTLEALHTAGLLHRIQDIKGVWRFCGHKSESGTKCPGNHIHFLCSKCDKMSCLPEQPLPWVTAPKGAIIQSKQLVVHGLCASCARRKKE